MQQTLVIIKPDGIQRALVGNILARFEARGMKIAAMKMMQVNRGLAERHYAIHKTKFFFNDLVQYIGSGPVIAMVLEGHEVIQVVRDMVGKTKPFESPPGTIRGDLALMGLRNLIHASDSEENAKGEIAMWFDKSELCSYSREIDRWINE